jgi:CRISPR system Cascade subunit CasE
MILSCVALNPACRDVWYWIRDPAALHGALWKAFPHVEHAPDARAQIALLHRLEVDTREQRVLLYAQADRPPRWDLFLSTALLDRPRIRSVDHAHESIREGDVLSFRLRAFPRRAVGDYGETRKIPREERTSPPRIVLRGDDARAWLTRRGDRLHGFAPLGVQSVDERISDRGWMVPSKGGASSGTRFDGQLRVTDVGRFREALRRGVGPQKAFGYGLLSVAPA